MAEPDTGKHLGGASAGFIYTYMVMRSYMYHIINIHYLLLFSRIQTLKARNPKSQAIHLELHGGPRGFIEDPVRHEVGLRLPDSLSA